MGKTNTDEFKRKIEEINKRREEAKKRHKEWEQKLSNLQFEILSELQLADFSTKQCIAALNAVKTAIQSAQEKQSINELDLESIFERLKERPLY